MRSVLLMLLVVNVSSCQQLVTERENSSVSSLIVAINSNIENQDDPYFQPIVDTWIDMLDTSRTRNDRRDLWLRDRLPYPEIPYYGLRRDVSLALAADRQIQCTVLGLIPVEDNHYMLKTMYTSHRTESDTVNLAHISTVYATKVNDLYQLVSSVDYHLSRYEQQKVGDITYVIHPMHDFQMEEALRMDRYNRNLAELYDMAVIPFSYLVANNAQDLLESMGIDFYNRSYQTIQSGGMADNYNKILYAGNNSSYYPHEVVHLYNYQVSRRSHRWIDEGIAALLGGSTGYEIEWHWQKLKGYITAHPDIDLSDPTALQGSIPNGEYATDWIYAIGGLICHQIRQKHGFSSLIAALNEGQSDAEYYAIIKDRLGVDRKDIGTYIKNTVDNLPTLSAEDMALLQY